MVERTRATLFVGRQRELTMLDECLAAAARGEGGVALVAGEPGIGKTRLLAELAERARADGWTVLTGRASDTEGMPPYLPFIEALRPYVRACPPERLRAQLGRGAAEVALLLPELPAILLDLPPSPAISPEQARYRLFESVVDFIVAIAGEPPGLLLLLDDLHWADTPTLLLLQHLARRLSDVPVLVVATHRAAMRDQTRPLVATLTELGRVAAVERIDLPPLDVEAVTTLTELLAGVPPTPSIAESLTQRTAGNPLFVREMVRHLVREGHDITGSAVDNWMVPETIRLAIARQLGTLSRSANQLLHAAAVLGEGFDFELLAAVSQQDEAMLLDALDETLEAGILHEDGGGYAFGHALQRLTVYESVNVPRRQRLHLQAARALETVFERALETRLTELAAHYRLAGALAEPESVIDACRRAGEAAAATFAWEEAVAHVEVALERLHPSKRADRFELLLILGDARMKAGDRPRARATFKEAATIARRLGKPERLARVALGLGGANVEYAVVDNELIELFQEALALLPTEDSALRARLLARLTLELRIQEMRTGSTALGDAAVGMAQRLGDRSGLARALYARSAVRRMQHDLDGAHTDARMAVTIAESIDDQGLALYARMSFLLERLQRGDFRSVEEEVATFTRLAEELRLPYYLWQAAVYRAMLALLHGQFDECESLIRQAHGFALRTGSEPAVHGYLWQLAALRREQGRLTEVESNLRDVAGRPSSRVPWRHLLLLVERELGAGDEVRSTFEQLADAFAQSDFRADSSVVLLVEVCANFGDREHAGWLYERLLPFAGEVTPTHPASGVCLGSVSRYLGILATTLGRWDAASGHFEQAIAMHERMGARPLLGHTHRDYATMLLARRRRGDPHTAQTLLARALEIYTELGMTHFAAKVRVLETDTSLAAMRPELAYPDGLSAREIEVLRLLAAGRTNREIAMQLVISLNTVTRHISHIFSKTSVANRAEAATYAARHGLLE